MNSIHLSALIVVILTGFVIPLLTGLLTKLSAHPLLKAFLTALLAAIAGFLTQAVIDDGSAVFTLQGLFLALLAFLQAQASYLYLYKPNNANTKLAPTVGIGGNTAKQG